FASETTAAGDHRGARPDHQWRHVRLTFTLNNSEQSWVPGRQRDYGTDQQQQQPTRVSLGTFSRRPTWMQRSSVACTRDCGQCHSKVKSNLAVHSRCCFFFFFACPSHSWAFILCALGAPQRDSPVSLLWCSTRRGIPFSGS